LLDERINKSTDPETTIKLECWRARIISRLDTQRGTIELQKLTEKYADNPEPYIHLSAVYWSELQCKQALNIIDEGLKHAIDKEDLFIAKSRCLEDVGSDDDFIAVLREAISQYPARPSAYKALAEFFVRKENHKEARAVLDQATATIPRDQSLLEELAGLLLNHFDPKEALVFYRQLVSRWPEDSRYRTLRGNVYVTLELNDLAMRDYKAAAKLSEEKKAWILANIGNLFKNRGFYDEAITFLRRAIQIAPNDSYAHDRLSQALKLQDEEEKNADEMLKEGRRAVVMGGHQSIDSAGAETK
jgi:tetratricopeptide (TPR) repeat protein